MKLAILGSGNAGCSVAADLSIKGHEVYLVNTSHKLHNDNYLYLVENDGACTLWENGEETNTKIAHVGDDLSVLRDVKLVIMYVQTNHHEELIKRIAPLITKDHVLLINPGYFSTAYVMKHCKENMPAVAEAQSSFLDCRIAKPGYFRVGFRNVRNPIGIYPESRRDEVIALLDQLNQPLTYTKSVMEASLHNPNMIVHTVGAIMSIPRIEKTGGDYCMYHEVFTPSTWNILEMLDKEKMDVLDHLGLPRLPYVEACKFRNSLDEERDAKEVFFWYAAMPTRAKGPLKVDSRYITEDVPEGLVLLEALGQHFGIPTPITTSLIEIASAALERDFRAEGRSLARLGEENIHAICPTF